MGDGAPLTVQRSCGPLAASIPATGAGTGVQVLPSQWISAVSLAAQASCGPRVSTCCKVPTGGTDTPRRALPSQWKASGPPGPPPTIQTSVGPDPRDAVEALVRAGARWVDRRVLVMHDDRTGRVVGAPYQ